MTTLEKEQGNMESNDSLWQRLKKGTNLKEKEEEALIVSAYDLESNFVLDKQTKAFVNIKKTLKTCKVRQQFKTFQWQNTRLITLLDLINC